MPKNTPPPGTEQMTRQQRVKLAGMRHALRAAKKIQAGYVARATSGGIVTAAQLRTAERHVEDAKVQLHREMTRLGVPIEQEPHHP